jgi:hypothetical protein
MDDFRVGSISPYDPIERHHADDTTGNRKRKHPYHPDEPEDIVELSEQAAEEEPESGTGYGPHREQP